jgi:hypothetical protein
MNLQDSGYVPGICPPLPVHRLWPFETWADPLFWRAVQVPLSAQVNKHLSPLAPGHREQSAGQAVLHFRCSDVPFNRNPKYGFPRYRWWQRVLRKNLPADVTRCTILWSFVHRKDARDQDIANLYFADLLAFLKDDVLAPLGVTLEHRAKHSALEDFEFMRGARLLVSGGSTFSWMAGLTGSAERVVVMEHLNCDRKKHPGSDWPNSFVETASDLLPHEMVADYHDVPTVLGQLRVGLDGSPT